MTHNDLTYSFWLAGFLTVWIFPLLAMASDKTISKTEKSLWIFFCIWFSWGAWILFLFLKRDRKRSAAFMDTEDRGMVSTARVLFLAISRQMARYRLGVLALFIFSALLFLIPSESSLITLLRSQTFVVASFLLLTLINRRYISRFDAHSDLVAPVFSFTLLSMACLFVMLYTFISLLAALSLAIY
ncbi:hypothetical protein [Marinimicrobium sp. C2-29]|uniref:hypothetical protein n=1 Tax=Marinimicrobium sp. C2-29 TaxID=3139825 RepID=UPI003139C843